MTYIILRGSERDLGGYVSDRMDEGWQCQGGVFIDGDYCVQAMVKPACTGDDRCKCDTCKAVRKMKAIVSAIKIDKLMSGLPHTDMEPDEDIERGR
jgi:hypothetical protein